MKPLDSVASQLAGSGSPVAHPQSFPGLATDLFKDEAATSKALTAGSPEAASPSEVGDAAAGGGDAAEHFGDQGIADRWTLPGEEPFVPWPTQPLGTRDVLDSIQSPRSAHRVQQALVDVIDSEGPVHVERLPKLVAAAFDLNRVAASRSSAILDQLPRGMRTGDIAWPVSRRPDEWKGFRRDPDAIRPVEHISSGELRNAMVALAVSTGGIQREELLVRPLPSSEDVASHPASPGDSSRLSKRLSLRATLR